MNKLVLAKIGSDPELVFGEIKEWSQFLVPADQLITKNRQKGLSAFIGTDGHMATAELRPTPAHNIRRHLFDIATALVTIDDYLKDHKTRKNLVMIAQPFVKNEALGGHIHISFFVNNPDIRDLLRYNYIYGTDSFVAFDRNSQASPPSMSLSKQMFAVEALASVNRTPTPFVFVKVMNYLLRPFECWVQLWSSRISRNRLRASDGSHYGDEFDIRWLASERPAMPKYHDWAYLHYEYRIPSTWLTHPWLAYAYLALTKLVVLNYEKITDLVIVDHQRLTVTDVHPANDKFKDIFMERLAKVLSGSYKVTNDIEDLGHAINIISENRLNWWSPAIGVFMKDWRELL